MDDARKNYIEIAAWMAYLREIGRQHMAAMEELMHGMPVKK